MDETHMVFLGLDHKMDKILTLISRNFGIQKIHMLYQEEHHDEIIKFEEKYSIFNFTKYKFKSDFTSESFYNEFDSIMAQLEEEFSNRSLSSSDSIRIFIYYSHELNVHFTQLILMIEGIAIDFHKLNNSTVARSNKQVIHACLTIIQLELIAKEDNVELLGLFPLFFLSRKQLKDVISLLINETSKQDKGIQEFMGLTKNEIEILIEDLSSDQITQALIKLDNQLRAYPGWETKDSGRKKMYSFTFPYFIEIN